MQKLGEGGFRGLRPLKIPSSSNHSTSMLLNDIYDNIMSLPKTIQGFILSYIFKLGPCAGRSLKC